MITKEEALKRLKCMRNSFRDIDGEDLTYLEQFITQKITIDNKTALNVILDNLMDKFQTDELPLNIYKAFTLLDTTLNGVEYDDRFLEE